LLLAAALCCCGSGSSADGRTDPAPRLVDLPDVTGMPADKAKAAIESSGDLSATFDPEPDDPSACKVTDQDQSGQVDPGTDVTLTLDCQSRSRT
jgi:hypothetical protein